MLFKQTFGHFSHLILCHIPQLACCIFIVFSVLNILTHLTTMVCSVTLIFQLFDDASYITV